MSPTKIRDLSAASGAEYVRWAVKLLTHRGIRNSAFTPLGLRYEQRDEAWEVDSPPIYRGGVTETSLACQLGDDLSPEVPETFPQRRCLLAALAHGLLLETTVKEQYYWVEPVSHGKLLQLLGANPEVVGEVLQGVQKVLEGEAGGSAIRELGNLAEVTSYLDFTP